jgi:hypothetical protein
MSKKSDVNFLRRNMHVFKIPELFILLCISNSSMKDFLLSDWVVDENSCSLIQCTPHEKFFSPSNFVKQFPLMKFFIQNFFIKVNHFDVNLIFIFFKTKIFPQGRKNHLLIFQLVN